MKLVVKDKRDKEELGEVELDVGLQGNVKLLINGELVAFFDEDDLNIREKELKKLTGRGVYLVDSPKKCGV